MSISHPPKPPNGGSAGCSEIVVSPDWAWLTKRLENAADSVFDRWMDAELSSLESNLSDFVMTSPSNGRRS